MKNSIKRNFGYNVAYQILLILVPLITTPYLSRTLGSEGVGLYSYTYSVTNYFVMFITLGISSYGIREIAACGDSRAQRTNVFWGAYGVQFIAGIIVSICYVFYYLFSDSSFSILTIVWSMWILAAIFDISWLLFGVEEFKIPTVRSMITKVISVIVIFLFVKSSNDVWIYCAAIAGSILANQFMIWPFASRYIDFKRPTLAEIFKHLKPNLVLFVPVIAVSLYTTMDKLMLGWFSDMSQLGFYEYSEKLSKMPLAVITSLGTVLLPRMTFELRSGSKTRALNILETSLWFMLAMSFLFAWGIAGVAPEFAPLFFGDSFSQCSILMALLSVIIPIISITNVIGRQYMVPSGKDSLFTLSVCIGAVVNIVLNLLLISPYGALGAVVSTIAAELSVLLCQFFMTSSELPLLKFIKSGCPFILIGFVMFIGIRVCSYLTHGLGEPTVSGLVIEGCAGAFIYVLLSYIYCTLTKNDIFKALLKQGRFSRIVHY